MSTLDPSDYNWVVRKYSTFSFDISVLDSNGSPVDITGCTARLQVRAADGSAILLELSTSNGKLLIDGTNGRIYGSSSGAIALSVAETTAITWSKAAYDLLLTFPNGERDKLQRGYFIVDQGITQ